MFPKGNSILRALKPFAETHRTLRSKNTGFHETISGRKPPLSEARNGTFYGISNSQYVPFPEHLIQ